MEREEGHMVREEFSEDELIQALINALDLSEGSDGYLTMSEMRRATGLSEHAIRRRLHTLNDRGQLQVRRMPRRNITGAVQATIAYRFNAPEQG